HYHLTLDEKTIGGNYDERSCTLYDFVAFRKAMNESIEPWQDRHLDLETEDFQKISSTGENIVRALWPKIDNRVNHQLVRLRLWETTNNRFTLRRTSRDGRAPAVAGSRPTSFPRRTRRSRPTVWFRHWPVSFGRSTFSQE